MEVLSNVPSVTYDYYQNNIKPKPQEVGKTEDGQTIWRCRICGYEYVGEELPCLLYTSRESLEKQWKTEQEKKQQMSALAHDIKTCLLYTSGLRYFDPQRVKDY